jgi:molybdenum cofactor cytidylyltransferase
MKVGAVVLAAGDSSRFGTPKQLAIFQGEPLVRRTVIAANEAGCAPVVVVLGADAALIAPVLAGLPVSIIQHSNWANGMGSSITVGLKRALAMAPNMDAAILLACDQPFVNATALKQMVQLHFQNEKPIVASAYAETLGIPVLFNRSCFGDLVQLRGDSGAKAMILARQTDVTEFDFPAAAIDVDTATDYEKLNRVSSCR